MAENRIYLRLSEGKREELAEWADQQGRPITNLASWLVEKAIDRAKETGEYKPSQGHDSKPRPQISALDVQKLADQLGIPSDRLLKAVKEIKLEVVNGCQISD